MENAAEAGFRHFQKLKIKKNLGFKPFLGDFFVKFSKIFVVWSCVSRETVLYYKDEALV